MNRRRGMTIMEMMVGLFLLSLVMAGLLQAFITMQSGFGFATSHSGANSDASELATRIAADLRRAALCTAKAGCGGVSMTAVDHAKADDIKIYQTSRGDTVRYFVQNGQVYSDKGAGASVLSANSNLQFAFYQSSSYNSTGLSSFRPEGEECRGIIAVDITATVKRGNVTGSSTTTVRLRNSPQKVGGAF